MRRSKKASNLSRAQAAFDDIVLVVEEHYGLTSLEVLHILNSYQQRILKYQLKAEWKEAGDEL